MKDILVGSWYILNSCEITRTYVKVIEVTKSCVIIHRMERNKNSWVECYSYSYTPSTFLYNFSLIPNPPSDYELKVNGLVLTGVCRQFVLDETCMKLVVLKSSNGLFLSTSDYTLEGKAVHWPELSGFRWVVEKAPVVPEEEEVASDDTHIQVLAVGSVVTAKSCQKYVINAVGKHSALVSPISSSHPGYEFQLRFSDIDFTNL